MGDKLALCFEPVKQETSILGGWEKPGAIFIPLYSFIFSTHHT
jgi:hypothetical protein